MQRQKQCEAGSSEGGGAAGNTKKHKCSKHQEQIGGLHPTATKPKRGSNTKHSAHAQRTLRSCPPRCRCCCPRPWQQRRQEWIAPDDRSAFSSACATLAAERVEVGGGEGGARGMELKDWGQDGIAIGGGWSTFWASLSLPLLPSDVPAAADDLAIWTAAAAAATSSSFLSVWTAAASAAAFLASAAVGFLATGMKVIGRGGGGGCGG